MKAKKIITSLTAFTMAVAGIAGTGIIKPTEVSAMGLFVNKIIVSTDQNVISVPLGTEVTSDYIIEKAGVTVEAEIGSIHDWPEDELYGQTTYELSKTESYGIIAPETFVDGINTLEVAYTGYTYTGVKVPDKATLSVTLDYKTGDITGDNKTNVSDLVMLASYIVNKSTVPTGADTQAVKLGSEETADGNATTLNMGKGDVNADGAINVFDLVIMSKYIMQK